MTGMKQRFRYRELAADLEEKIRTGVYQPGERLPSIRKLHHAGDMSVSTVYKAFVELETMGLVEARPRSGYYVAPITLAQLRAPEYQKTDGFPREVRLSAMINSVVSTINDPRLVPFGMTVIDPELLPVKALGRILAGISRNELRSMLSYALSEGQPELRRQICRRTVGVLDHIGPEDILVTNGCMEAVALALLTLTRPGDTVAIETPTNFSFLQLLKELGRMVVEVPTDPETGVDIRELEAVFDRLSVSACLLMPNFQNPLGTVMPEERKEALMRLVEAHGIPVIEDDISSELYFGAHRPRPLKAFDRSDRVLTCSSFSKTLAPGLRIGWMIAGPRFRDSIRTLKAGTTVSTSSLAQHLVARFLSGGAYDRHVRRLRLVLKQQATRTALAVQRHFPPGTRLALPKGGTLLWIQLPGDIDSRELYRNALRHRIGIVPGSVCSNTDRFHHHIMINYGMPYSPAVETGLQTLGNLAAELGRRR